MVLSARALAERGHRVTVIGGHAVTMPAQLGGIPWFPATSTLGVTKALWRHGPADIVHVHMTAAESAAVLALPRTGGRLVTTRHFAQRRGKTRGGQLAAAVIERIPHTEIAISKYVEGRTGVRSVVVYHGVPDQAQVDATGRRVVVIQRLEGEKSTDVAIRAWARSRLGEEGWELAIAGDGAERERLEALARSEGVACSVRFLGHVDDVVELRAASALQIATPSTEHFGLSVLEAMSAGLPVLAADGGAHRELLGDGYEGLFRPGEVEHASLLLRQLATDRELRRALGTRLMHRQREVFSLSAHGEALEDVYSRAIGASAEH